MRLKKWGFMKNLKLQNDPDENTLRSFFYGDNKQVVLGNGMLVDRHKLITHLVRKNEYYNRRKLTFRTTQPRVLKPPEKFYVLESMLMDVRLCVAEQYDDLCHTPDSRPINLQNLNARRLESSRQPINREDWQVWGSFTIGVKGALEAGNFEEAVNLMRWGPALLEFWLKIPHLIPLRGFLWIVTVFARVSADLDEWQRTEFMKLIKLFLQCGDYFAALRGVALPSEHPLRRVFRRLSSIEGEEYDTWRLAWKLCIDTQDGILMTPERLRTLKVWLNLDDASAAVTPPPLTYDPSKYEGAQSWLLSQVYPLILLSNASWHIEKDEALGREPALMRHLETLVENVKEKLQVKGEP